MLTIPPQEGSPYDFYVSDAGPDIAAFPGGLIEQVPKSIPIRLQRGDMTWGGFHIAKKHGHWLRKQKLDVHEMVWMKLRQPGAIYCTENKEKFKISLRVHPTALMILRHILGEAEEFLTVVSVYLHPTSLDGEKLATYKPLNPLAPTGKRIYPSFYLPASQPMLAELPELPAPSAPTVIYKKRRRLPGGSRLS